MWIRECGRGYRFSLTLKPKSLWEEGAGRPIDLSNVRKKVANLARYMRLLK